MQSYEMAITLYEELSIRAEALLTETDKALAILEADGHAPVILH